MAKEGEIQLNSIIVVSMINSIHAVAESLPFAHVAVPTEAVLLFIMLESSNKLSSCNKRDKKKTTIHNI